MTTRLIVAVAVGFTGAAAVLAYKGELAGAVAAILAAGLSASMLAYGRALLAAHRRADEAQARADRMRRDAIRRRAGGRF